MILGLVAEIACIGLLGCMTGGLNSNIGVGQAAIVAVCRLLLVLRLKGFDCGGTPIVIRAIAVGGLGTHLQGAGPIELSWLERAAQLR